MLFSVIVKVAVLLCLTYSGKITGTSSPIKLFFFYEVLLLSRSYTQIIIFIIKYKASNFIYALWVTIINWCVTLSWWEGKLLRYSIHSEETGLFISGSTIVLCGGLWIVNKPVISGCWHLAMQMSAPNNPWFMGNPQASAWNYGAATDEEHWFKRNSLTLDSVRRGRRFGEGNL